MDYHSWKKIAAEPACRAVLAGAEVWPLPNGGFFSGGHSYTHGLQTKRGTNYVVSAWVMRAVEATKEAHLLSATSTSTATDPHMVTQEVFAATAQAVELVNHGRRWDVKFGSTYSAFSDQVTAEAAIADVHRAAVNNALYLNAYPIGDTKPDMPPAEVLAQYQDVVARFPELGLTPNAQIGLVS